MFLNELDRFLTRLVPSALVLLLSAPPAAADGSSLRQEPRFAYPEVAREELRESFHGVEVLDPYRWLEDMQSERTHSFVDDQERCFERFMSAIPHRERLRERLRSMQSYDARSVPVSVDDRSFFTATPARASQGRLLMREAGQAHARVLFDPELQLPADAEVFTGSFSVSPDARFVSIRVSPGSNQWNRIHVIEVESGKLREDVVHDVWGGASWTHDGQGFFYVRFPKRQVGAELSQELGRPAIYHHLLGTPQSQDRLIYERPDQEDWLLRKRVSSDGHYLMIFAEAGSSFAGLDDEVSYIDLRRPGSPVTTLIPFGLGKFGYEGNHDSRFWFRTSHGASRGRLIVIDADQPQPEHWQELVSEDEGQLSGVSVFADRLVLQYNLDARQRLFVHEWNGQRLYELSLPAAGRVSNLSDRIDSPIARYSLSSLYDPGSHWQLDLRTGESALSWRPELSYDPDQFEMRQVFYTAEDGTRIPMFLAGRKGFRPDGRAPVFVYGYGALGWSAFPWYQPQIIAWMEAGGLYALPGIRGGGEYGEAWQQAGSRRNKPVGIRDFITAAEWLIDSGYAHPEKVVVYGSSASGVLAAAAMMQRPDLYGASLIDIPKLDMLRYHLFTGSQYTVPDFGSAEDAEDFAVLRTYSPYHNIRSDREYPPTLVMVGELDATAPPLHGYKFVARMQAESGSSQPALLMTMRGAGHGYGNEPEQRARHWGDAISFLLAAVEWPLE